MVRVSVPMPVPFRGGSTSNEKAVRSFAAMSSVIFMSVVAFRGPTYGICKGKEKM